MNRSVPTDMLVPHVAYEDVDAAMRWLNRVFGFVESYRYGPPSAPQGGQMRFGSACIQLHSARPDRSTPRKLGAWTQMITLIVPDARAMHERVRAAGAELDEALNDTFYGERQFSAKDPEGHRWLFSQHITDVDPAGWAVVP